MKQQGTFMRAIGIVMSGVSALMSLALTLGSEAPARAGDVPDYFKEIVSAETATPAEIGAKNILALNTTMFELYGNAGQIFKKNILAEHPVILGLFSGAGGRFILYRPGQAPYRRAAGSDRLSAAEVGRPQHDGAVGSRRALSRQPERPDLAQRAGRLPQPNAIRPRWARRGADARRLEAGQPRDPREQHRVHGRGPEGERDLA